MPYVQQIAGSAAAVEVRFLRRPNFFTQAQISSLTLPPPSPQAGVPFLRGCKSLGEFFELRLQGVRFNVRMNLIVVFDGDSICSILTAPCGVGSRSPAVFDRDISSGTRPVFGS